MSSGSGPRHLAGPRASALIARNRSLAVVVALLLLLVLAVAAGRAVSALGSRLAAEPAAAVTPTTVATVPSTAASGGAGASTTVAPDTTTPTATTVPGNLLGNPGFESGLDGWQPIGGARVDLADVAHEGGFGIRLSRGSAPSPGVAYPAVTATKAKGATYVATAWVQATRPGITGEIHLLEYLNGRRFAVFRSGLDLRDRHWHCLQVAQLVHVKGSTLGLEVVAPDLPGRTGLLVDDVAVRLAS
jgi:Carbohydrate binding domain